MTMPTSTRFVVRYRRRDPAPRDHLMDIAEQLDTILASSDRMAELDAGPAISVDFPAYTIEVLFSVDADNLSDALVKAADVQVELIGALSSADAEQAIESSMEPCPVG
jgi:hypothetical protein